MNLVKSRISIFLFTLVIISVFCYEDNCGIYPSCHQYGDGAYQILEDCHKYIICETVDGEMKQTNTECEREDQVFANEFGRCVDWEMATECKSFQENAVCLAICPRVMLVSYGPALTYQERRTGCFRIAGSLFGNTLAFYENMHLQYLTPDSDSTPLKINWLVSERPGSFNGGIKNNKYDYIRCPFDNWGGWEVDKGQGHWVVDQTMQVTCYSGDEVAPIPFSTTTTTTTPTTTRKTTTQAPASSTTTTQGPCKEIGKNPIPGEDCSHDFYCCTLHNGEITYKTCTCKSGLWYNKDTDFKECTWGDMLDPECYDKKLGYELGEFVSYDHTCSGDTYCD